MINITLDLVKQHLLKFQLKDWKGDLQIMFISMNFYIESNECFYESIYLVVLRPVENGE